MLSSCSRVSPQSPIKEARKLFAFQGQQLLEYNRPLKPWLKDIGNGTLADIRILPVQIFTDGDFYPLEDSKSNIGMQARLKG